MEEKASTGGTLYLVATPIGHLGDLSPRAAEALRTAELIVAEDTRRAQKLLAHLGLRKPLESFHAHSEAHKRRALAERLSRGQTIAYVCDGGTPGIADPGRELVQMALEAGAAVVPVPGPCALIAALSASGMKADRFVFGGFPPRQPQARRAFLERLKRTGLTIVLYEAPHRIQATLQAIAEIFGERPVLVARELTKLYEEFQRGSAVEIARLFTSREPKGEFVIVIEGEEGDAIQTPAPCDLQAASARLLQAGLTPKAAAEIIAELGLASRNEAYRAALTAQQEMAKAATNNKDKR